MLPGLKVCYFDEQFDGKKWWYNEVGKIPDQKWELSLREGFPNETLYLSKTDLNVRYTKLRKCLLEHRPHAVVLYGYYQLEHWMVWWLCISLRIPMIFIGETFERGGNPIRRVLKMMAHPIFFRQISQVISIGNKTATHYQKLRIPPERLILSKYCVDGSFFQLGPEKALEARRRVRRELGIPENSFILLFVARLFERKRPADFIEIYKRVAHNKSVHAIIVGNGPLEESLRDRVRNIAGIQMVGFKNQCEIRNFYHASDILIVPSQFESWGLVVNEAFACGLPAIVTSNCGVADDLVVQGESGFSYPVGDIGLAVSYVQRLLEDPKYYQNLRENAFRRVTSQYHVQQFCTAMAEAFKRCLGIT